MNNELKKDFKFIKDKHEKVKSRKIRIAIFGSSGAGKSSFINFLVTGRIESILESSGQSEGCTRIPCLCDFYDSNFFQVKVCRKGVEFDSNSTQTFRINETREMSDYLTQLNENYNQHDLVIISIPLSIVNKDSKELLREVELIDLVGVPDRDINGSTKNREALEYLSQPDINNNEEYLEETQTHGWLDAIFLIKTCASDRGKCIMNDIIEMGKSGLFKSCNQYRAPMIVSVYRSDEKTNREKSIEVYKEHIIASLCEVFNYPPPNNYEVEIDTIRSHLIKDWGFLEENIDKKSIEIMIKMVEFLDWNLERSMINDMIIIINKIKKFKRKSNKLETLYDMAMIEAKFKSSIKPKIRNIRFIKNAQEILSQVESIIPSYEDLIEQYIFDFLNNQIANLPRSNAEVNEYINGYYYNLLVNLEREYISFIDEVELFLQNINSKNITENVKDLSEYKEENYLKKKIMDKFNSFSNNSGLRNFIMRLKEFFLDETIENDHRCWFQANMAKQAKSLLHDISENLFSNEKIDRINDYIKLFTSLENNSCSKFIKDHLKHSSCSIEFNYMPPKPRRFSSRLDYNLLKIFTLTQKKEIRAREISPNWYEFLTQNKLLSHNLPRRIRSNDILERLENGKKPSSIHIIRRTHKGEFQKECINISRYFSKAILIQINKGSRQIFVDYETEKIDLSQVLNKVMLFESKYFIIDEKSESKKDLQVRMEIEREKKEMLPSLTKRNEQIAIYPIFIWLKNLNETKRKNILLKSLAQTVDPRNFVIFLFLEIGELKNKPNFQSKLNALKSIIHRELSEIPEEFRKNYQDNLPIITVCVESELLGEARILKLMFLLAQHLDLPRFYVINDQIKFYEFSQEFQDFKSHQHSPARALTFMSKVMQFGIYGLENNKIINSDADVDVPIDEIRSRQLVFDFIVCLGGLGHIYQGNELFEKLKSDICKLHSENCQTNALKVSILNSLKSLNIKERLNSESQARIFASFREFLLGPYSTTIGQVSLMDVNDLNRTYLNRLISKRIPTHGVNKPQNGCILYNSDSCMERIHPITDDEFFSTDNQGKFSYLIPIRNNNGSVEEDYFYYRILNGISGFVIFYFGMSQ